LELDRIMTTLAYRLHPLHGLDGLTIRRIAVGSRTDFEAMNAARSAHQLRQLRPVIDRRFSLEEAVEAHRHFRDGNPFGKVVITI
jgi:NADPH:quinone reductase-like Zn-dependent oxidoreductase